MPSTLSTENAELGQAVQSCGARARRELTTLARILKTITMPSRPDDEARLIVFRANKRIEVLDITRRD